MTNDNWQIHHPGFKPLKYQEFKDFIQVRTSIQVERPRVLMSYWNGTVKKISRNRFQEINNHLVYNYKFIVAKLNEQFQAHWNVGSEVTLDELLDLFTGNTLYYHYIPRKPHRNGHLIYEVMAILLLLKDLI